MKMHHDLQRILINTIMITVLAVFTSCDLLEPEKDTGNIPIRELTIAEKSLVSSDNKFGLNLFRALNDADPDSNLFISPLSISMALGMTLNGAADSTYEAMKNTLELAGLTETEINESYQSLIKMLTGLDPEVIFTIANSIWYREGLPVYGAFKEVNQTYFNAEVQGLDFRDPGAKDVINEWVKTKTNDLIPKIIDGNIPEEIVMYLINAIYFKGNWRFQFDKKITQDGVFHNQDGSESTQPMMFRKMNIPFLYGDGFAAVDIPYGDSLFSMTIFLPDRGKDINTFAASFTQSNWDEWILQFSPTNFNLIMPRFELEYEKNLNEVLSVLGMEIAFDEGNADFSRIMPLNGWGNLFISEVKHKTFIQVDEEGTEAAAATSVGIGLTSNPPTFRVDRPFVLAIRENHSGTILFIGKIADIGNS